MSAAVTYRVKHETLYKYSAEVVHAHHLLHLVPRAMPHQACSEQSIRIVPELDLVVVVTAGYYQDYSPQAFKLQSGIFRDVLRAISPPA